MKNFLRLAIIIGTLPNTLTNGTVADATQVMADLNKIVNDVNANAAPLANTALLNTTNNFTAVQTGVAATSGVNFPIASQVQNQVFNTLTSTLGTNTITARIAALTLTGYATGQVFTFIPSQPNTGAATLDVDGLGAKSLFSLGSSLAGGELLPLIPALVEYDGTQFNIIGPNGSRGAFTITGTGFVANPTGTAFYSLTNKVVTLHIPPLTGTSNATGFTLTGLPAAIRPLTAHQGFSFASSDNGAANSTMGRLDVETNGTCTLYSAMNAVAASWTAANAKAVTLGVTITYNLD